MSDIRKQVGSRIRKFRENRRLSVEALSAITGISPLTLSSVERGSADPRMDMLEKIAKGLLVEVTHFLRP